MQVMVAQYQQKLHFLQVYTRFFKMIQMDMVIISKNVIIIIFE
jgi:hypothetical protein